ncbi:hypothetical protein CYMTET_56696 [Cymbomonas tetramitiformis]|uniref:F-box/LRR-repeat protein 15-like leucin rich repeat domain-containing protein n=1 Tax=Cymbomonas tetramitiformis TaxID=36881 RepID=A0AAE0BAE6_9CHLO|nr:hypothetical protein CYMTET_56696 [Cymbomonas tetramitiformis]
MENCSTPRCPLPRQFTRKETLQARVDPTCVMLTATPPSEPNMEHPGALVGDAVFEQPDDGVDSVTVDGAEGVSEALHSDDILQHIMSALASLGTRELAARSAARQVCRAWREIHDLVVDRLEPRHLMVPSADFWGRFRAVHTFASHRCTQVTNDTLGLLRSFPKLSCVHLFGCMRIDEKGLQQLPIGLTSLQLSNCTLLNDDGLHAVLSCQPSLKKLELCWCAKISDRAMQAVQKCSQLTDIDLEGTFGVGDKGILQAAALPLLQTLGVAWNSRISDTGLRHLAATALQLTSLNAKGCSKITDAGIAALGELTRLRTLDISQCKQLTCGALASLRPLCSLTELNLRELRSLTNDSLSSLSGLMQLKCLNLAWCTRVNWRGLRHLSGLCDLTELQLAGLELAGADLPNETPHPLCILVSLVVLNIRESAEHDDAFLRSLAPLRRLTHLSVSRCGQITDDGIASIVRQFTRLEVLDLSWCGLVTDAGVASLTSLPVLRKVDLAYCRRVTTEGRDLLRQRAAPIELES